VCAGAIILDNARVGPAAVVARDTVVPPGKALAGGMLYAGVPALAVRPLSPGELAQHCLEERMLGADREKRRTEKHEKPAAITLSGGAPVLVCDTVCADGAIRLDGGVSIWFGTNIFCPNGKVEIGARSNIQDNTFVLVKGESALVIGRGVTVGHNATLEASRIMDGALVGMGAHVTHGTVIEEHACLAAGAVTLPNSVITSGTLWAGRPARRIRALTEEEQVAFAGNADIYCDEYLNAYAKSSGWPNADIV
jgi:carbonic anhydrase/acetyltransferase-like protein (isoleucine patch superfamily)